MNQEQIFQQVKGIRRCQVIYHSGNHFVFIGKKFATFQEKSVSYHSAIHATAWKVCFLPNQRLLVDGGADEMYHLISLPDGKTLISQKVPGNRIMRSQRFAVSPGGNEAFDYWCVKNQFFLVKIQLDTLEYEKIPLCLECRALGDIVCLSDREVCLLQFQHDGDGGKKWCSMKLISMLRMQDTYIPLRKYQWKSPSSYIPCATDGRFVLNKNLWVQDLQTGKTFYLLENTEVPFTQKLGFTRLHYYEDRQILQLCDGRQNDFVDCNTRKIIARYHTPGDCFMGALVGDTFWYGTDRGIERKPFPAMEEIPGIMKT